MTDNDTENFLDDDAVVACANIVARSGATGFEIGYLRENVPADEAGWYARAQYDGGVLHVGEQRGPDAAADALARRVLRGGRCTHCSRTVTLSGTGTTGTTSTSKRCRWTRMGRTWTRGCEDISWELPAEPCPVCKRVLSGATGLTTQDRPQPGDVTVCVYCASILVYAANLTVREPIPVEWSSINADEGVQRAREAVRELLAKKAPKAGQE